MGTMVSIDIRDPHVAQPAVAAVTAWLHHVDDTFSTYKPDSPISAIGRGDSDITTWTDEIREVLRLCETVRRETGGAFSAFDVPAPNGTRLDPSGLVKGWSIERAAAILESYGVANFCINAGGDIALRGCPSEGSAWRVGIRHPNDSHAVAAVIHGSGQLAVATSATYSRGAHIIDPRTKEPAMGLASATITGPDLTLADAYATAVFVMGLDGLEWIEEHPAYDAYLITHDGTACWSPGFARYRDSSRVGSGVVVAT